LGSKRRKRVSDDESDEDNYSDEGEKEVII